MDAVLVVNRQGKLHRVALRVRGFVELQRDRETRRLRLRALAVDGDVGRRTRCHCLVGAAADPEGRGEPHENDECGAKNGRLLVGKGESHASERVGVQ